MAVGRGFTEVCARVTDVPRVVQLVYRSQLLLHGSTAVGTGWYFPRFMHGLTVIEGFTRIDQCTD